MRIPAASPLAFLVASVTTACSLTTDTFSCGIGTEGAFTECYDFEQVADVRTRPALETLCRTLAGNFSTDKCPADRRLGGCRDEKQGYFQTTWYYPSSRVQTEADARGRCGSTDVFVAPDGTPQGGGERLDAGLSPDGGQCSRQVPQMAQVTFRNATAATVSAYWVDFQCAERFYFSLEPGASQSQSTFETHIWRFRQGRSDPRGAVVFEYVTPKGGGMVEIK